MMLLVGHGSESLPCCHFSSKERIQGSSVRLAGTYSCWCCLELLVCLVEDLRKQSRTCWLSIKLQQ
jgi:hypothetical protein